MPGHTVLVFGPTGAVAGVAARTAHENGAKVCVAMRDPSKAIFSLDHDVERVQADLTEPATVQAAVRQTGATRVFLYRVIGTVDHMKTIVEVLKAAGVELVVFLSSYSVVGDPRDVLPSEFIPNSHAQVEVHLKETFGADGHVALRPAWFASNARQWSAAIRATGQRSILYPEAVFDWIAPSDVGRVAGTILARGLHGGSHGTDAHNPVNLCGPQLMTQREAVAVIGRTIQKDITVRDADEEEGLKIFTDEYHLPPPVAKYLVATLRKAASDEEERYQGHRYEEAVANVEKYAGTAPVTFPEWVEANREVFSA